MKIIKFIGIKLFLSNDETVDEKEITEIESILETKFELTRDEEGIFDIPEKIVDYARANDDEETNAIARYVQLVEAGIIKAKAAPAREPAEGAEGEKAKKDAEAAKAAEEAAKKDKPAKNPFIKDDEEEEEEETPKTIEEVLSTVMPDAKTDEERISLIADYADKAKKYSELSEEVKQTNAFLNSLPEKMIRAMKHFAEHQDESYVSILQETPIDYSKEYSELTEEEKKEYAKKTSIPEDNEDLLKKSFAIDKKQYLADVKEHENRKTQAKTSYDESLVSSVNSLKEFGFTKEESDIVKIKMEQGISDLFFTKDKNGNIVLTKDAAANVAFVMFGRDLASRVSKKRKADKSSDDINRTIEEAERNKDKGKAKGNKIDKEDELSVEQLQEKLFGKKRNSY